MKKLFPTLVVSLTIVLAGCFVTLTPIEKQKVTNIHEERFGDHMPWREGRIQFNVQKDVDSVYPKVKREFGFLTLDETLRTRSGHWKQYDTAYKHEAQPGSFYNLRKRGRHTYESQLRGHNIAVLMEKNSAITDVRVMFWLKDPEIDIGDYAKSMTTRIEKLFVL